MGKTRLAEELVAWARSRRWAVEVLRVGTSRVPLGALIELIPDPVPAELWGAYRAALRALAERSAGGRPLLLVVDDAQLLDEVSAALIHHATRRSHVLPVLTVRAAGDLPGPIAALWADGLVAHLRLGPLDRDTSDALVEAVVGADVSATLRRRVWELAAGNPLLIRELLETGVDRLAGPLDLDPGERLVTAVTARIGVLSDAEREVAELLAVAHPLELDLLVGDADGEARRALTRLEQRGLVRVHRDGRRWMVSFAHPLYGEVLAAGLGGVQRRERSAQLAGRLAATGLRRRRDLVRLARLQLDAGVPPEPTLAVRAAAAALQSFDYGAAEQLARMAWQAAGDPQALLVLGEALLRTGRGQEAETVLAEGAATATDPLLRCRILVARAHALAFALGRVSDARRVLDDALAECSDGPQRLLLRVAAAWVAALGGSFKQAIHLGREVLDDPAVDDELRLRTAIIATLGQVMVGRIEEAQPAIDLGLELARRLRAVMPDAEDLLWVNRVMGAALVGDLDGAAAIAQRGYDAAVAEGAPEVIALWANTLGFVAERRGRLREAHRHLTEAEELSRHHDPFAIRGLALGLRSVVCAQVGDRAGWQRDVEELTRTTAPEDRRTAVLAGRAQVWGLVLEGRDEQAARCAAEQGRAGLEADSANWAVVVLHDAVRIGVSGPVVDLLDAAAGEVDRRLVEVMARHAHAVAAEDPAGLLGVADAFAAMGFEVYALEAYAQAQRAAAADRATATRARARIAELRPRHPQLRTPALRILPPLLTRREAQIARLATRLTSREIAEELSISVRTVDNHLASVYAKLGIGGRDELRAALGLEQL